MNISYPLTHTRNLAGWVAMEYFPNAQIPIQRQLQRSIQNPVKPLRGSILEK